MKRSLVALVLIAGCGAWILLRAQATGASDARLWRLRNLGKAFYENPTTEKQSVDLFRQALGLAPNSTRERLNYGLALLRAASLEPGIAELEKVQKSDPKLPHTWFNLGVTWQKQGEFDRALAEFTQMVKLVPDEPVSHYHMGALLKLKGDSAAAIKEFETARDLSPRLAAPHFQLFGLYRQAERQDDAARELRIFQDLKKEQEGAAVPEDMDWSYYSEIYDPLDAPALPPPSAPVYRDVKLGPAAEGAAVLLLDGVHPSLVAWSRERVTLYRAGAAAVTDSGLEALRDVVAIAPGDFDNDGLPDLCVVTTTGAVLYRNVAGKFQKHADLAGGSFRAAYWVDFDHDYDVDLLLVGADSKLLRNNGEAGFSDETARFPFVSGRALSAQPFQVEPDTPGFDVLVNYEGGRTVVYRDKLGGSYQAMDNHADVARPPIFADFAGTGRADQVVPDKDGSLVVRRDVTPNYGNWTEVALTGVKNARLAYDAKVEVKAGAFYSRAIYRGVPLVFRIGARTQIDTVRISWPNGMIQNETQQAVNRILTVKEAPRLSGSCPMIFTWSGERFDFITDVLGVAPLGASSGDGQYFPVDHDEYVSIPGERLRAADGRYQVRVTEELHEVSYIDQIKLIALDHPAAIDIVTNEKFKAPPFPEFRLFGASHRIYPKTRTGDGSFRRNLSGVAEMHTLDLDFSGAAPANRAVLVLHGWVDWADGSTFLAAVQEHRDLTFPYIQVKDAAGNWKTVIEDMGIPSGKPKSMAVDLTGKFLSASREVRIVTNLCVYWDEIYLVDDNSAPPARMTTVPYVSAGLRFRGFSRPTIHPQRTQPESFDYQVVSPTSNWNPTRGNYTRYGAVESLLGEPDDRMVIMGSGDELALEFNAAGLPALPAGWKRDFLLLVDGWAKDADANTAFSQSVLPLPFHGMTSYPYPATQHFPDDDQHRQYLREYVTRPALRLIRPLTE